MAFTLRLAPELEKRLKAFAEEWGVSQHAVVTMAITDYLLLRSQGSEFAEKGLPGPQNGLMDAPGSSRTNSTDQSDGVGSPVARELPRQQRRALAREMAKKGRGG